ncbi:hypothetical protein D3C75_1293900 [compost metagenome]
MQCRTGHYGDMLLVHLVGEVYLMLRFADALRKQLLHLLLINIARERQGHV